MERSKMLYSLGRKYFSYELKKEKGSAIVGEEKSKRREQPVQRSAEDLMMEGQNGYNELGWGGEWHEMKKERASWQP